MSRLFKRNGTWYGWFFDLEGRRVQLAKRRGEYLRDIEQVMPDGFSPEYRPRTRFLTARSADALFRELTADRSACVAFILATGARWSEAVSARLEDVDEVAGLVFLRGTKTEHARRVVPIVGAGVPLLAHALRYAQGTDGRLFMAWGSVRRDLAAACRRAKIDPVTPNDLRRTVPLGSASGTWSRTSSEAFSGTATREWSSVSTGGCRPKRSSSRSRLALAREAKRVAHL